MDYRKGFFLAMANDGIITDAAIIADGQLHRFHIEGDKPNTKNGWYVLYPDNIPSGAYGNWKTGVTGKWCSLRKDELRPHEYLEFLKKAANAQLMRDDLRKKEQHNASLRAERIWSASQPTDPSHPYLVKKQIEPFSSREYKEMLILPIRDLDEKLWSLQFIKPDGEKILLANGAKKSNFILINNSLDTEETLICEGFATGCTLAKHFPTACVIAAIDAGNLESVALEIVRRYGCRKKLTICADDDRLTDGNPGLTKARKAAIITGALLASPQWPKGTPTTLTDFNDLACWAMDKKKR